MNAAPATETILYHRSFLFPCRFLANMATRTLAHGVAQLSIPSLPSVEKSFANNKRHAIYIPQSFFEKARRAVAEADDASTWEFSATTSSSSPVISESSSSAASSPAQEIIIRYRSGMPLQLDASETQSNLSIDDEDDDVSGSSALHTPVEGPESLHSLSIQIHTTEIEGTEIGPLCRQSCHQGLSKAVSRSLSIPDTLSHPVLCPRGQCEEAFQVIGSHDLRKASLVACQQSGHSHTLWSARDRVFQLHVHDIHHG